MANMGALVVNLEANIASFTRDMQKASQQTETAMNRMAGAANMVKGAIGLIGVGFAADALMTAINRSVGALADLDDMAQKTGASVEGLSKLGKVATMTATDFGSVDGALVKLSKSMADVDGNGGKVRRALESIGISADGIEQKDPAKVFVEISRKLQDYEDGAVKVALVNDLMGKSAADLLPYMNDVAEKFDDFTGDSAEAAAAATKFQDEMGKLKVSVDEWLTSMLGGALPALNDFIDAIKDVSRETDTLTDNDDMTTWADDVALVFARMADGGALVARTFKAIGAEIVVMAANVEMVNSIQENINPFGMAKVLAAGGSPNDNIKAALAKRNDIVSKANVTIGELFTTPLDKMERAMQSRIAGRSDAEYMAGVDGLAGLGAASGSSKASLKYDPSTPKKKEKTEADKAMEAGQKLVASLREQDEAYGKTGASLLEYQLNQTKIPESLKAQALAHQTNIDAMKIADKAMKEFDDEQKKAAEEARRVTKQNEKNVEDIAISLMSELEQEQNAHQLRLAELQTFHDAKLENVSEANELIKKETERHEKDKYDIQQSYRMQSLGMMGSTADMLYDLLKKSGDEQSSLAKAAFLVSKAIAVAEIIMNTNVAASKAKMQLGIFGLPMSAIILATGYSQAAMVAGLAIASAEGGYDIPAGTNPVTQLHEKEMVLPRAQADVIRGLARNVGGAGGVTINNNPQIHIDARMDQAEVHKLVVGAVQQGNADLVDKLSRAGRI